MNFGFETFSDSGRIQVDSDDPLLMLAASGTVSMTGRQRSASIQIPSWVVSPMVFARCITDNFICFNGKQGSAVFILAYQADAVIDYKIYCPYADYQAQLVPQRGFGIHVFNGAGDLTYSSNAENISIKYSGFINRDIGTQAQEHTHGVPGGYVLLNMFNRSMNAPWPAYGGIGGFYFHMKTLNTKIQVTHWPRINFAPAGARMSDPFGGIPMPLLVVAP